MLFIKLNQLERIVLHYGGVFHWKYSAFICLHKKDCFWFLGSNDGKILWSVQLLLRLFIFILPQSYFVLRFIIGLSLLLRFHIYLFIWDCVYMNRLLINNTSLIFLSVLGVLLWSPDIELGIPTGSIKVFHFVYSIFKIIYRLPSGLFLGITLPVHEIVNVRVALPIYCDFFIQYAVYFIFLIAWRH